MRHLPIFTLMFFMAVSSSAQTTVQPVKWWENPDEAQRRAVADKKPLLVVFR